MSKVSIIVPNLILRMPRILDLFLDQKTNRACGKYPDHAALFMGLKQEETGAIRCLAAKISGSVYKIGKNYQLTDDDIEELICDSITLCLQKIKGGQYVFQGYAPSTFVVEIAKNKAQNFRRSALRHGTVDMEHVTEQADEPDFTGLADTELLERLLHQLDENCQNLIRLKYLEELRDKDVIEQKITQYTTVDALKNNRARCMKKLVEIGRNNLLTE